MKGNHAYRHFLKECILLCMVSLYALPMFAQVTYKTEPSIDVSYIYGNSYYYSSRGSLVGTLAYNGTGSKPDSLCFSGSPLGTNGVTFTFLKSNGHTFTKTIDAICYVVYTNYYGCEKIIGISSSISCDLSRIDWDFPVNFYIFFDKYELFNLFDNVSNKVVSVSTNTFFNLQDYCNTPITVTSNLGNTTQPIPLLGGGLIGPSGTNSIPATNLYYYTNTADIPEYSIGFTVNDVSINDLCNAIDNPIKITDLKLGILNYDDVYMGQTNVQVRFFQNGHASFAFVNNAGNTIPFRLSANGNTIIPNARFFPWTAPLGENNLAPKGFSVTQTDYDQAEQGTYTATITVELITGV